MFIKALERVEELNNKGYKLTDVDKNSWWKDFKVYSCCIEQKPVEWSKEDLDNIERCITKVEIDRKNWEKNGKAKTMVDADNELIDWLKSLKDRVLPQPKQEWIEEDDEMLYGCIETEEYMLSVVDGRQKFDVGNEQIKEACQKELDWLKSLEKRFFPSEVK